MKNARHIRSDFQDFGQIPTEVVYNSDWLAYLCRCDNAGSKTTSRMLERDDFQTRYRKVDPLVFMSFLSINARYDSVALAD